jgi:hypothetical protein
MSDALRQDSELATASWLRDPLEADHQDELVAWHGRFAETAHQRQPLSALFDQLQGLYPKDLLPPPQLLEFRDLLWLKGSGGLFDGHSGRVVQASCVSRFLRQRQLPFLRRHRIELSQPLGSFPRLEQVVWLPTAGASLFGELFTEVLGFLWPFLLDFPESLLGWPVLLPGCDPQDAYSAVLHQLLREHHTFPLLELHLPEALHLERVLIPEPGFRLHAACTPVFLQAAAALADRLSQGAVAEPIERLYLAHSDDDPLAPALAENGWAVLELLAEPLPVQVAAIRAAQTIAGFGGEALHALAWLGELLPDQGPQLLLLGTRPSLDLLLQFRVQGLNGWYLPCADDAGVEVINALNSCVP